MTSDAIASGEGAGPEGVDADGDEGSVGLTLRDLLQASGAVADDAVPMPISVEAASDGATTWSIRGVVFATLDTAGTTAAFRLDAVVAGAAQRTPDTAPSFLGPDWVEFRPVVLDGHAADRATAWFQAAARRAVG